MGKIGWPEPVHGDYIINDFKFKDGRTLPELRLHYRTLGRAKKEHGVATNALLIMHGTGGSGAQFFCDAFAGYLFNRDQLLSAHDYFLIFPDSIGHGQSSKPSDGLRAKFPRYCYSDMVRAHHMLLTKHLGINHLRLVMGTSMGGMHTWVWGTMYPDFMDALMPLASLPNQISGRNRMWRKHAIDSIRNDPEFNDGEYQTQLRGMRSALHVTAWMVSSPLRWQKQAPDWDSADDFIDKLIEGRMKESDPNDFAYAFDASWEYDPQPKLKEIKAPLTAVNSADDQVNPPELRILEKGVANIAGAKAIILPITEKTNGHATHIVAECWHEHLADLIDRSSTKHASKL